VLAVTATALAAPEPDRNPWADLARERKAIALADQLQALSVDSEECPWLSDAAWAALSHLAGVNYPSELTKGWVVVLLEQREEVQRRMAAMSNRLPGVAL
jgi:hypothetical protein